MCRRSQLLVALLAGIGILAGCEAFGGPADSTLTVAPRQDSATPTAIASSTASAGPRADPPTPTATLSTWAAEAEATCADALRRYPRSAVSHEEAQDTAARLALEARALRQAVPQKNPPPADADEHAFLEEILHYSQRADEVVRHLDAHPEDLDADEILETDQDWSDFSEVLWKFKAQSYELESAAAAIGARSCAALTLRF